MFLNIRMKTLIPCQEHMIKPVTSERLLQLQKILDALSIFPEGRFKVGPPSIVSRSGNEFVGLYHEREVPGMGLTIVFERNLESTTHIFSNEEFLNLFVTVTKHYTALFD